MHWSVGLTPQILNLVGPVDTNVAKSWRILVIFEANAFTSDIQSEDISILLINRREFSRVEDIWSPYV